VVKKTGGLPVGLLYGTPCYRNLPGSRLDIELDDLSFFGKPLILRFQNENAAPADHVPTEEEWELAGWILAMFPQLCPWLSAMLLEPGMQGQTSRLDRVSGVRIEINRSWLKSPISEKWSLVLVGLDGKPFDRILDFSGTLLLEMREVGSAEDRYPE
jgi:hypothetical protein